MPTAALTLVPHRDHSTTSIRRIYIQNLTDLLHVCLLRGEVERAKRAWAILIRCREVDWKSRWYWGLELLSATSDGLRSNSQLLSQEGGRDTERWLVSLRIASKEHDKPALLHALVLHLINNHRHRAALDELETYLPSVPYLLSAPLHTYAGLLAFYLAQPPSARAAPAPAARSSRESTASSTSTAGPLTEHSSVAGKEPLNASLVRQARGWFGKAVGIDANEEVAAEFIRLIDNPVEEDDSADEQDDEVMDSKGSEDDEGDTGDEEVDEEEEGKWFSDDI
ncbi:RNA polymerase I-specific transcription initiation factor RRN11, partial [Tremellales sp. Uapishka_1]